MESEKKWKIRKKGSEILRRENQKKEDEILRDCIMK